MHAKFQLALINNYPTWFLALMGHVKQNDNHLLVLSCIADNSYVCGTSMTCFPTRFAVPTRVKQTPPPTSYSSSEDEEWEDAVEGGDDDAEDKRTKRERKESAQSQHSQHSQHSHLVNNTLIGLPLNSE